MQLIPITTLRKQIYAITDRGIKTGVPAKFNKDGHVLTISVEKKKSKLANLKKHNTIVGDPKELIDLKVWEWHEQENLK